MSHPCHHERPFSNHWKTSRLVSNKTPVSSRLEYPVWKSLIDTLDSANQIQDCWLGIHQLFSFYVSNKVKGLLKFERAASCQ